MKKTKTCLFFQLWTRPQCRWFFIRSVTKVYHKNRRSNYSLSPINWLEPHLITIITFPKRVAPENQWHGKSDLLSTEWMSFPQKDFRDQVPSYVTGKVRMWIRKWEWMGNTKKSESKFRCNWIWLWARVIMIPTATHTAGSDNDLGF